MILYFSGTGNSLKVAQQIAESTNDEAVHINNFEHVKPVKDNKVGFVFPVYNNDIPLLVENFIKDFEIANTDYVYCIITHGGDKGNAILNLQNLLKEKGIQLAYANDVLMPVSSRIMYGMVTDKIEERTSKARDKVQQISRDINNDICNVDIVRKKYFPAFMHLLSETDFIRKQFTPVVDSELCTGCGICKSVCPKNNISMQSGKAFVGDSCVQCMTCMHWCSQVAIHYKGRKVKAKQQYHHPDVKLSEIVINK